MVHNQFIATTITGAFIDYDITLNDRIVIQWSSCQREDRYLSEVDHNGRYNYWRVVEIYLNNLTTMMTGLKNTQH